MRLAAKVLDALVTPDMLRSLDVSVKQAYFCDSEQALVQLQAMAQQAPLNCKSVCSHAFFPFRPLDFTFLTFSPLFLSYQQSNLS